MKAEVKELWTTALRSGEYRQGETKLHYKSEVEGVEKYCCLGVLCAIAVKEGVIPAPYKGTSFAYEYDGEDNYLPEAVIAWAELPEDANTTEGVARNLARQNDNGTAFAGIAEIIERDL